MKPTQCMFIQKLDLFSTKKDLNTIFLLLPLIYCNSGFSRLKIIHTCAISFRSTNNYQLHKPPRLDTN